ncbi:hypothetical protein EVJ58_g9142 [Rhodofomes roseus]|uniref:F-box/LRR-repeat protein 15-like leucin rich repeat domain-containing protein n=1 Tax=Rhodofomes roseus TaxID=34475 RepID=A0A4Y9XV61_9APHY|nr:hypothetical protein EVJ58_g9142 [Rhodofomes roseus]
MSFINRLPLTQKSCYDVVHLALTQNDDDNIIDDDLAHILPWCPNLESVCLTGVPDVSDRTVVLLARGTPNLRELDLSGCTLVTDVAILELANIAMELEEVRLNGLSTLTDPSVSALARSLTNLRELELCDLHLLTPPSIRDIWTFSTRLQRLKLANCVHLTDKAFPYVPGVLPDHPSSLTTSPLEEPQWTNGSRPPTWLETLPPLIFSLGHKLTHLRFLDISNCPRLTDTAVVGIVMHAPRIQHLNLSACSRLTDNSAEAVSTLQHLHVLALSHITLDAVHVLLRKLSGLKHFSVSGVPALRRTGIERFSDKPSRDYDPQRQGIHRVFNGANIVALREFLDKEQARRQRAEQENIIFVPKADDSEALY